MTRARKTKKMLPISHYGSFPDIDCCCCTRAWKLSNCKRIKISQEQLHCCRGTWGHNWNFLPQLGEKDDTRPPWQEQARKAEKTKIESSSHRWTLLLACTFVINPFSSLCLSLPDHKEILFTWKLKLPISVCQLDPFHTPAIPTSQPCPTFHPTAGNRENRIFVVLFVLYMVWR